MRNDLATPIRSRHTQQITGAAANDACQDAEIVAIRVLVWTNSPLSIHGASCRVDLRNPLLSQPAPNETLGAL